MLGFAVPQYGQAAHAELARFAATAEGLGADSLWVGDRLLAAVQPSVGYQGKDTIPEQFRTGIGWSPEEYEAAGAPFRRRGAQLDELLDALEKLWTTNPVEHTGERWSIPASWVDLKPVQRPHPPIYLAAFTPAGLKRIGERADGWSAVVQVPAGVKLDMLNGQRQAIDDAARAAGREPSEIQCCVRVNVAPDTPVGLVADALRLLADNGYPDAFVDLLYVATDTDSHIDWAERLLAT